MHYDLLTAVVKELALLLRGARLDRVIPSADNCFFLVFRKNGKNFFLLISLQRWLPCLHLVSAKPPATSNPHPLVLMLRSRLIGSRLAYIGLANEDRVVEMRFLKDTGEHRLIFELTGSSTNLILTDGAQHIIMLYYPVSVSMQAHRVLAPGIQYVLPHKMAPSISLKTEHGDGTVGSANRAAELCYEHLLERRHLEVLRSQLRSAAGKAMAKATRRRFMITEDLQASLRADEYRQKGDLILANLSKLKPGMEYANLVNNEGTLIRVQLDPKRTPVQNAEQYFGKSKKAKKGFPILTQRLLETEEAISRIESLLTTIDQAEDIASLRFVESALIDFGIMKQGREAKRKTDRGSAAAVRTIHIQGWDILVGRSAAGNDYLSTKLAQPHDLWLHAEGLPGSHILVKNPKKADIPHDILIKAASLAAFYSKGKGAGKVPVTYTEAKYVRKPKGAKPGLVTLSQRETIMVVPTENLF